MGRESAVELDKKDVWKLWGGWHSWQRSVHLRRFSVPRCMCTWPGDPQLLAWHQPLGETAGEKRLFRPLRPYQLGTPAPLLGKVKGAIIGVDDKGRRMCWRESQAKAVRPVQHGGTWGREMKRTP